MIFLLSGNTTIMNSQECSGMDVAGLTRHLLQNSASHIIAGWIVMLSVDALQNSLLSNV